MHKQSSKCLWTPGAAQVRSSLSVKSGRFTETISTIRVAESQPIVNPHGQRIAHLWRSGLACRSYTQCQSNGNETCESRGFESLQVCRNLNSPLMVDSFSDILTRCNWYFPTFFFFFSSSSLLFELLSLLSSRLCFAITLHTWGNGATLPVISSTSQNRAHAMNSDSLSE